MNGLLRSVRLNTDCVLFFLFQMVQICLLLLYSHHVDHYVHIRKPDLLDRDGHYHSDDCQRSPLTRTLDFIEASK